MDNDNKRNSISLRYSTLNSEQAIQGLKNKTLGTALITAINRWKPLTFRSNDRNRFILAKQLTIDRAYDRFPINLANDRRVPLLCRSTPPPSLPPSLFPLPRVESGRKREERGRRVTSGKAATVSRGNL